MRVLLWMMGAAFILMFLLGLIFHIVGLFIWFVGGIGLASVALGFIAGEEF